MKKIFFVMAVALVVCTTAKAQRRQMTEEERNQQRAEMIQRQTERMAKDLDFDDDAKKTAFMTTYMQYQYALQEAMGDMSQMFRPREEEKKAEKMTDEECYAKIKEVLDQQEQQAAQSAKRLEVTKKYLAEFMTTLTPQQLYKVFGQRQRGFGNMGGQGGRGGNRGGGFGGGMPGGGFGGGGFGGGMPGGGF